VDDGDDLRSLAERGLDQQRVSGRRRRRFRSLLLLLGVRACEAARS
jgi:hypothetical protein